MKNPISSFDTYYITNSHYYILKKGDVASCYKVIILRINKSSPLILNKHSLSALVTWDLISFSVIR